MSRAVQLHILAIAIATTAIGGDRSRVAHAQIASANVAVADAHLSKLARSLDRLQAAAVGVSEQQLAQTRDAVNWLRNSVTGEGPNRAMLDGLRADADALDKLPTIAEPARRALVEAVFEDLQLKRDYCREKKLQGMNALVKLAVQTWDGPNEVRQWQVAYQNAPLAILHRDQFQTFPKFSSPTEVQLPPGRYVVWAQDPRNAAKRGPVKEVALGQNGAAAVQADVVIPRP